MVRLIRATLFFLNRQRDIHGEGGEPTRERRYTMRGFFVYLAVIIGGASVLAIEIVGTRVIAPFYGASLYLWSALIGVTLAALSLGYAVGGRIADRGTSLSKFSMFFGLAGLWIVIIPWLRMPVLAATESLGLRSAVLITATVLFFPPLTLLGMVSPYAIRLQATTLSVVGRTAGNLYALSTVSSVFAAIITGFFLIPNMGVYRLIILIGLVLMATAALGLITERRTKVNIAGALLLVAFGSVLYRAHPVQSANPDSGLIAIEQSAYAEIRVVEQNNVRYMVIDGGTHTIVDPQTWESYFPYVNVLDIAALWFDRPGDMLLIGLGGGSVVKRYASAGWTVDAVEIDPVVTKMAYEHFGLKQSEARVFEMDGRQFLMATEDSYELIIMDAFGSSSIPFHLVTSEAFALIHSRLSANGLFAMNLEAVGWDDIIVKSLAVTVGEQFEHVVVLPMAEPPDQLGNLVIMASDRPLELKEELPGPAGRFTREYHRVHAWDNRFTVASSEASVLTDDLNPIDIWAERVNLVARRQLHEAFSERGLTW